MAGGSEPRLAAVWWSAAKLEPALAESPVGRAVQFERLGYFAADAASRRAKPVFNRTVALRDSWARMQAKWRSQ